VDAGSEGVNSWAPDGNVPAVPEGWVLLPPGDAALTRRVKAAGEAWAVAEKKGRKVFSRGGWAPATTVERVRSELEAERSTEGFTKRKEANARRREKSHTEYVEDFFRAVVTFLGFHPDHAELADRLTRAVTDHAGRQRDGRPHQADSGRTTGRGGGDRLDAAPDHRLRLDEDRASEG
jgi:TfoX/Sxy family transcriptional regulator of competence genes